MNEIEVNKATGDFRFLEIGEPMESKAALSILLFGYGIYSKDLTFNLTNLTGGIKILTEETLGKIPDAEL